MEVLGVPFFEICLFFSHSSMSLLSWVMCPGFFGPVLSELLAGLNSDLCIFTIPPENLGDSATKSSGTEKPTVTSAWLL